MTDFVEPTVPLPIFATPEFGNRRVVAADQVIHKTTDNTGNYKETFEYSEVTLAGGVKAELGTKHFQRSTRENPDSYTPYSKSQAINIEGVYLYWGKSARDSHETLEVLGTDGNT